MEPYNKFKKKKKGYSLQTIIEKYEPCAHVPLSSVSSECVDSTTSNSQVIGERIVKSSLLFSPPRSFVWMGRNGEKRRDEKIMKRREKRRRGKKIILHLVWIFFLKINLLIYICIEKHKI